MRSDADPVPQLLAHPFPDGVEAFSTTRQGGVGQGNYAEFNVNDYCGDDKETIAANRRALCRLLDIPSSHLVFPHQTHGVDVRRIDRPFFGLSPSEKSNYLEGVDAVITDMRGVCIGVSTADCIPVLLYDPVHQVTAAIHAGWRGTVERIVRRTVRVMTETYHTQPRDLFAVIGPGISLARFEVGQEVYDRFAQSDFPMEQIARRYAKWHIDLPLCNRQQLIDSGLHEDRIHDCAICTYDHADRFFSARRLGIRSGRILTAIMMR